MLAVKRQNEILHQIKTLGTVRTVDLAAEFAVAEETIRRDLDRLHEAGRLVRVHGGARSYDFGQRDLHRHDREKHSLPEKKAIARVALDLINEHDTIFIDASSTALQLAQLLPGNFQDLTVVTNSLGVVEFLGSSPEVKLLLLGGRYDSASGSMTGMLALEGLTTLGIDRAFFSCKGVDVERGLSEACEDHAGLKRILLAQARQRVLLADGSKFGVCSNFFFGELMRVDTLVTDSDVPVSVIKTLQAHIPHRIRAAKSA